MVLMGDVLLRFLLKELKRRDWLSLRVVGPGNSWLFLIVSDAPLFAESWALEPSSSYSRQNTGWPIILSLSDNFPRFRDQGGSTFLVDFNFEISSFGLAVLLLVKTNRHRHRHLAYHK
jgi:hypothetical protein